MPGEPHFLSESVPRSLVGIVYGWDYDGIWSSSIPQLSFLINENILVECFRTSSSFLNHRISPLTRKYEPPRLSLFACYLRWGEHLRALMPQLGGSPRVFVDRAGPRRPWGWCSAVPLGLAPAAARLQSQRWAPHPPREELPLPSAAVGPLPPQPPGSRRSLGL